MDLTWGGLKQPPPGKQPSGTFMSSNQLVTDQAHKNGQFYDLKRSKIIFNFKRDSRMTQKFQFFKNLQMTSKLFPYIEGVIATSKLSILSTFQGGGAPGAPLVSSRVK